MHVAIALITARMGADSAAALNLFHTTVRQHA